MTDQSKNPFNNNLPNQIAAIVDALDSKPRIVQCIQACNEEQLIEACMLQVYDKVDKIIVIEGAVKNKVDAEQATPDGHSLDRTVEIIEEVKNNPAKNPDKKITFVRIDRPWVDLEELKNTFFQYMQDGDWMLITDVDEFIMPEVVDSLREAISLEPWMVEFVPAGFYHFWRDSCHVRRPSGDWGQQHQRFIRFQQGLNYANHPVARDKDGVCTYFDPRYLSRRMVLPSFVVYHYSYCKDDGAEVKKKKDFYDKELGQDKHGDVGAYARGGQTDEFLNHSEALDDVLWFGDKHPPILTEHPMLAYKDPTLGEIDKNFDDPDEVCNGYEDFRTAEPYSLEHVQLIWIFAREGKQGYDKLFNLVDA